MADPALDIAGLEVAYGRGRAAKQVLHHVDLHIGDAETLGLVGESGSGKTTVGRAVLGLAPVSAGRIVFLGEDITHAPARARRRIATKLQVVFQDPYRSLNPAMTVRNILTEPLIAQGMPPKQARVKVRDLLDRVAMPTDALDRYAREFSGGQRQRVAIARALALEPRLVVCDEPVSALDLTTQLRVLDLLFEIQQHSGVSYLFISHDLAVVRHISHRIAVMNDGRLVETGTSEQVADHPQHPYTQRLWASTLVADPAEQAERRATRRRLAAAQL
jgi:ABC-type glutathione transport system ATPase component